MTSNFLDPYEAKLTTLDGTVASQTEVVSGSYFCTQPSPLCSLSEPQAMGDSTLVECIHFSSGFPFRALGPLSTSCT